MGYKTEREGLKKSWQGARQGQMAKEMKSYCGTRWRRTKLKNGAWELEREPEKEKLPRGSRAEREELKNRGREAERDREK